jgi:hypothetical protein
MKKLIQLVQQTVISGNSGHEGLNFNIPIIEGIGCRITAFLRHLQSTKGLT